jgi:hypothetical protein
MRIMGRAFSNLALRLVTHWMPSTAALLCEGLTKPHSGRGYRLERLPRSRLNANKSPLLPPLGRQRPL